MQLFRSDDSIVSLIGEQAELANGAAGILCDAVHKAGLEQVETAAARIRSLEQEGDQIIKQINVRLKRAFAGYLDPADLATLAGRLDDVLDGIAEIAHRFKAYRIQTVPEDAARLFAILRPCAEYVAGAASALANKQDLLPYCEQLHALENDADDLGRSCLASLLDGDRDAIDVIEWKEIYEFLESTADRCEDRRCVEPNPGKEVINYG